MLKLKNDLQVIFVTGSDFPDSKSAGTQKLKLMVSAMTEIGIFVKVYIPLVLTRLPEVSSGNFKGATYRKFKQTSPNDPKFIKGILTVLGYILMFVSIIRDSNMNRKSVIVLSYTHFPLYIISFILAKILSMIVVVSIMEYHPSIVKGKIGGINARLFDHWFVNLCDGLLPITKSLERKVLDSRTNVRKALVIPALADYDRFIETHAEAKVEDYFVICTSVSYKENIDFCRACINLMENNGASLRIVLYGKESIIRKTIEENSDTKIMFITDLSDQDLYDLYASALALLIPMRTDNEQDLYRFPQKIAEYLVSSRPIITNSVGIIHELFVDDLNACVLDEYNPREYAKRMDRIFADRNYATTIGRNGFQTGKELLHYKKYSKPLYDFFFEL